MKAILLEGINEPFKFVDVEIPHLLPSEALINSGLRLLIAKMIMENIRILLGRIDLVKVNF